MLYHESTDYEASPARIRKNTKLVKIATSMDSVIDFSNLLSRQKRLDFIGLSDKNEVFSSTNGESFRAKKTDNEERNIVNIFSYPGGRLALADDNTIFRYHSLFSKPSKVYSAKSMISKIYGEASVSVKDVTLEEDRMFAVLDDDSVIISDNHFRSYKMDHKHLIKNKELITTFGDYDGLHIDSSLLKSSDGKPPKKIITCCLDLIFAMFEDSPEILVLDLLGDKKYLTMNDHLSDLIHSPRGAVALTKNGESAFLMSIINKNRIKVFDKPVPTGIEPSKALSFCAVGFASVSNQGKLKIWGGHIPYLMSDYHPTKNDLISEFLLHDDPAQLVVKHTRTVAPKVYVLTKDGKFSFFDIKD